MAGCPSAWTSGDMTKYKENDEVSVIKSNALGIVEISALSTPTMVATWDGSMLESVWEPLDHRRDLLWLQGL